MSNTSMKARIVRIEFEEGETGLFYATSPDLKGLLVAEPTIDELEAAIPQAITDLYEAIGETYNLRHGVMKKGGSRSLHLEPPIS